MSLKNITFVDPEVSIGSPSGFSRVIFPFDLSYPETFEPALIPVPLTDIPIPTCFTVLTGTCTISVPDLVPITVVVIPTPLNPKEIFPEVLEFGVIEEIVLKALLGDNPSEETKEKFRSMLRDNQLNDKEIEIALDQKSNPFQSLDIPGMPGAQMGMINMNDIFGKGLKNKKKTKLKIGEAYEPLIQEEIEKIAEKQNVVQNAIKSVQESGIVFIDEIDKIAPNSERRGGDVSREGVQRDLLPLIEGTVVSTKYGTIETNHILFIASGAFHQSKPSDLLPELQGRLPVRVRLNALRKDDFIRILKETDIVRYQDVYGRVK